MDANAKLDAGVSRTVVVPTGDLRLDLDRAAQRIDDAGELDEEPVSGGLDQPTAVRGDRRIYHHEVA